MTIRTEISSNTVKPQTCRSCLKIDQNYTPLQVTVGNKSFLCKRAERSIITTRYFTVCYGCNYRGVRMTTSGEQLE